jgi:DNA mismatch repair ATPase MutS
MMDAETIKNLELVSSIRTDDRKKSLFGVLNHTKTAQGGKG